MGLPGTALSASDGRVVMSFRGVLRILIALSVLFAPPLAGAAMAASPGHGMPMTEMGHCESPPATGSHDKMAGKSCCISVCMAVAVMPSNPIEVRLPRQQVTQSVILKAYRNTPARIATPPPRLS